MKVAIVYDDQQAGNNAMRTLRSLALNSGVRMEFSPELWRADLLEDPNWFSEALADGVAAEMVIISTSSPDKLGKTFKRWIETCLTRKRGTDTAIITLSGPDGSADDPVSLPAEFVRRAAQKAGLGVFSQRMRRASCEKANQHRGGTAPVTRRLRHRENSWDRFFFRKGENNH